MQLAIDSKTGLSKNLTIYAFFSRVCRYETLVVIIDAWLNSAYDNHYLYPRISPRISIALSP